LDKWNYVKDNSGMKGKGTLNINAITHRGMQVPGPLQRILAKHQLMM